MLEKSRILTLVSIVAILITFPLWIIFDQVEAQAKKSAINYPFQANTQNIITPNSFSSQLEVPLAEDTLAFDEGDLYFLNTLQATQEELLTDDGTVEVGMVVDGMVAVNRLTPSSYPAKLERIRIRFDQFQGLPSPIGQQIRLIAFADSSSSGQPTNSPTLLINQFVTVPQIGAFVDFNVSNITINSGDIYVGYQTGSPSNGAGFSADKNGPQRQRAFISTNGGASYSALRFTDGSQANLMIRAVVSYDTVIGEEELKSDDGTMDGRGILQDNLVMVNRLTPSSYPVKLKTIRAFFTTFQNKPSPVGQNIRLVAFTAPSGNQPPTNPIFQVDRVVMITEVNKFIDFAVDGPTINSGDIYVGYQSPSPAGGVGYAADTNGFQYERAFFSTDNGNTFIGPTVFSDSTKMNLMVRAVVSKENGGGNPDFALNITPKSQTISVGATTSFTINLQSINGFNQPVTLTTTVNPSNNITTSLSTNIINPGGNATLTFNALANATKTNYTITVVGAAGTVTRMNTATVTVTEPGSLPIVTIQANVSDVVESSTSTNAFTITRASTNTSSSLAVNYNVTGSATNGVDYQTLSGSLLIPAGTSNATIIITPIEDTLNEGDETLTISLSSGSGYQLGTPTSATIGIIDNEALPTITISRLAETVTEMGVTEFTINSNINVNRDIEVHYQVSGNASPENDYAQMRGKAVIYKGTDHTSIPLVTMMDNVVESSELVTITLTPTSSYQVGSNSSTTINILDNTKSNGAVVDTKNGAVVAGENGALAIVPPSNKSGAVTVSISKLKSAPKKIKVKNDVAIVSDTYTFNLSGNNLDRLIIGIPIAPHLLSGIPDKVFDPQYQDPKTKAWVPIGDRVYYDNDSKAVYFRVETVTPIQTSSNDEISALAATPAPLAGNYRLAGYFNNAVTENPNSKFKVHYTIAGNSANKVPANNDWNKGTSCSGNTDSKIPNYVLDLDKYLNEIYDSMLSMPNTPFSALSLPQHAFIKPCGSNGTEAGESPIGGPMAISNGKISSCQDMRQVAAHELVHVFQGQYYTNGKLGYIISSIIGNNWFVDAVANYYAIKALKLNDSEIKAYLEADGGLSDYLSVSLTTDSDNNRYGVSHFLLWLEKEYKTDIVAKVLKTGNSWDLETLSEQLKAVGAKDGLETAFDKYGAYLQTHPEDYDGVNSSITGQVWQRAFGEKFLSGSVLSDKVYYHYLQKTLEPLSMAYVEMRGNNSSDAMLVVNFLGSDPGIAHSYTYDFASNKNADFIGKTPLEKEPYLSLEKSLTIKHFGQKQAQNTISQMITYPSRYVYNSGVKVSYYLLVPPIIKAVEDGKVTWTFDGIGIGAGQIPTNFIRGFDVYNSFGIKMNTVPITAFDGAKEASYSDPNIKSSDKLTVTIVDRYNNSWPEVQKTSPPLQSLKGVYINADLFFKDKEVQIGSNTTTIPRFHLQAAFSLNSSNATFSANSITAYGVKNGYDNELVEFRLTYDPGSLQVTNVFIKTLQKSCSNCSATNLLTIQSTNSFTAKWYRDTVTLSGASTASGIGSNFKVEFNYVDAQAKYTNDDIIDTLPGYSYNASISVYGIAK